MSDLPSLLLASLAPASRKQAEAALLSMSQQPGFLPHLLRGVILEPGVEKSVRLAGGVYFKNAVKRRWSEDQDEPVISPQDKETIREQLVPAMISLSSQADKGVRAQIAETVSTVAQLDFPAQWPSLIDQLVASLSPAQYSVNLAILETAHSIFGQWRSQFRTDTLYTTINLVLSRFMDPFLAVFRATGTKVLDPSTPPTELPLLAQTMLALVQLFYDLTAQDLPPALEDAHLEFFGPAEGGKKAGWFLQFLAWNAPSIKGDPDDTTPSLLSQVKTTVLEVAELYTQRFGELVTASNIMSAFVQAVWEIVGGGNYRSVGDDSLVAQCMRFLSTTIKSGHHKEIFGTREIISQLVEGVIIPNVQIRDHDVEQFEDDPLEYVRLDLSQPTSTAGSASFSVSGGGDGTTRRQAAADVLRALTNSGWEAEVTEIGGAWISRGLQDYNSNPKENWKSKDTAIYLLTAVAARSSTTQLGVTSANALVDIVKFFSDHIAQDLQADLGSVHPILQVDAIRFLYTFRNQLTKEQLLAVLPLLSRHLGSANYVCYTYAAITIERILFIKQGNRPLFTYADVQEFAKDILSALLSRIEAGGSPEKVAENDYLMKCAMRVIITSRQTLTPVYTNLLQRLVTILGVISANPSNPNFTQYCFESIAALMRFVVKETPSALPTFESSLFQPFTVILQNDIDQFIPYTFQILSQMLEYHTGGLPAPYQSLLGLVLSPPVWQQKGSIPGLVRLLRAVLACGSQQLASSGELRTILAIVQQRLIPSKVNDIWGFDLLQAVVQSVPVSDLTPMFRDLLMSLLLRLQSSKTDRFTTSFAHFIFYSMAIQREGLTPDYLIAAFENVQPSLWSSILRNVILPIIPKVPPKDKKVVAIGMAILLTQSKSMIEPPNREVWPVVFATLQELFIAEQGVAKNDADDAADVALTSIDYEEQNAGFQVAYSRLTASEPVRQDPVAYAPDPRAYLFVQLDQAAKTAAPGRFRTLMQTLPPHISGPFAEQFTTAGYAL